MAARGHDHRRSRRRCRRRPGGDRERSDCRPGRRAAAAGRATACAPARWRSRSEPSDDRIAHRALIALARRRRGDRRAGRSPAQRRPATADDFGAGRCRPRSIVSDFARPDAPWLVVVFSSATCDACASMVAKAHVLATAARSPCKRSSTALAGRLHERYAHRRGADDAARRRRRGRSPELPRPGHGDRPLGRLSPTSGTRRTRRSSSASATSIRRTDRDLIGSRRLEVRRRASVRRRSGAGLRRCRRDPAAPGGRPRPVDRLLLEQRLRRRVEALAVLAEQPAAPAPPARGGSGRSPRRSTRAVSSEYSRPLVIRSSPRNTCCWPCHAIGPTFSLMPHSRTMRRAMPVACFEVVGGTGVELAEDDHLGDTATHGQADDVLEVLLRVACGAPRAGSR